MPSNSSRSLAEISSSLSNDLMLSLSELPEEINVGIAAFLDHESLVRLGATCTPLRTLVLSGVKSHWNQLHEKRWTSGKLLRFIGLPSQRPLNGNILNDKDRDWKVEFARRFILDKSVRDRVASLSFGPGVDTYDSLVRDGADIYDKLRALAMGQDRSIKEKAVGLMRHINEDEAHADMNWLRDRTDNLYTASVEDSSMIINKLGQTIKDLLARNSSDQIYDEIRSGKNANGTRR